MRRNRLVRLKDYQILTLIKNFKGPEKPCLADLMKFARKEKAFKGTFMDILNAVNRLEKDNKITTNIIIRDGKRVREIALKIDCIPH